MAWCHELSACPFLKAAGDAKKLDQGIATQYHTEMMYGIDAVQVGCPFGKSIIEQARQIQPKSLFSHPIAPRG